jgi:quercetin dioxygenase-like cupin family protein
VINVYVLTIPGKIDPDALPYNSHEGKEFLYVLEGDMIFFYGDTNYRIKEGDSLYFKANVPHKTICVTESGVGKLLMVISFYSPL